MIRRIARYVTFRYLSSGGMLYDSELLLYEHIRQPWRTTYGSANFLAKPGSLAITSKYLDQKQFKPRQNTKPFSYKPGSVAPEGYRA